MRRILLIISILSLSLVSSAISQAAPQRFFYEDYEDGNASDSWNPQEVMEITTLNPRPGGGTYSARTNFTSYASGSQFTSQVYSRLYDKYDKELYFRFYFYFDNNFDMGGVEGNFKIIRLRSRGFASPPIGERCSTEIHFGPSGGGLSFIRVVSYSLDSAGGRSEDQFIYADRHPLEKGGWHRLQIYVRLNDKGARTGYAPWGSSHGYASNGICRIWLDGRRVFDFDDWEYLPDHLDTDENKWYRLSTPSNISSNGLPDDENHFQEDDWEMWDGLPLQLEGDINQDGRVDIKDLILVAKDFGKTTGFNPACDLNGDARVDIKDLIIVAKNFGKTG